MPYKFNSDAHLLDQIRSDVRTMTSYVVPDANGFIKLDAMENPYDLPSELKAQLGKHLSDIALNRYPVPTYSTLQSELKKSAQIPDGFQTILGNGSDELIHLLSMAFSRGGENAVILAPAPAFVMYRVSALLNHVRYVEVDLLERDGEFVLDVAGMILAIEEHQPKLVYLPFPNNPTGCEFSRESMLAVIEAARRYHSFVVIDEAYQPFAENTWMDELPVFDNLLLMRTVSKLGLAGVRLGYMVGRADVILEIEKIRPPYNINVLTEAAVIFMLQNDSVFEEQAKKICDTRALLFNSLREFKQLTVFRSHANFILVRFPDAQAVFDGLKLHGILVKNMSYAHPLLKNCLRLTVGSVDENNKLLNALMVID